MEFHLHPYLTKAWMPRGRQMRVPAPGQNRKTVVFGACDYGRGIFLHHLQPRKTAWGERMLLPRLVRRARRTGRRIILVMDQGSPHHAASLKRDLRQARPWIQVFWLPKYSPDLNRIEMLWRYMKRQIANFLFANMEIFVDHMKRLLDRFLSDPDFTCSIVKSKQPEIMRKKLVCST